MLFLRSSIFQVLFYGGTLVMMIVGSPLLLLPQSWGMWIVHAWGHVNLLLLRLVVGLKVEWRGTENIPEGGYIVASKHQSAWETFALIPHFAYPTFILKRELRWIPIFGWYLSKFQQIPINRGKRAAALTAMMRAAKETIAKNRQIMIFPEGTRRPPGAEPAFKFGIAYLYKDLNCRVLPVALNAGLYWPRRSWMLYPGTVIVEFLPPIEPGLSPRDFHNKLVDEIETTTNRLCEEARHAKKPSPMLAVYDENRATTGS